MLLLLLSLPCKSSMIVTINVKTNQAKHTAGKNSSLDTRNDQFKCLSAKPPVLYIEQCLLLQTPQHAAPRHSPFYEKLIGVSGLQPCFQFLASVSKTVLSW